MCTFMTNKRMDIDIVDNDNESFYGKSAKHAYSTSRLENNVNIENCSIHTQIQPNSMCMHVHEGDAG